VKYQSSVMHFTS